MEGSKGLYGSEVRCRNIWEVLGIIVGLGNAGVTAVIKVCKAWDSLVSHYSSIIMITQKRKSKGIKTIRDHQIQGK